VALTSPPFGRLSRAFVMNCPIQREEFHFLGLATAPTAILIVAEV
jgi:hypothetical protein